MITGLSTEYEIKGCCDALGVSRSGFYRWRKAEPAERQKEELKLLKELKSAFQSNKARYGSPRLTQWLRRNGRRVGKNRVARLMRKEGLRAKGKRAFRPRTTVAGKLDCPNLVKDMEPTGIDQVWLSDITYVATAEGWLYLAVILDQFSRRVVGWKISDTLEAGLVGSALENALRLRRPGPGLIFHSDRGSQYSSHVVRKPLELIGGSLSMSAQGNCYDNAKAEAFFSTLKTECFPSGNVFSSKAQARRTIFEYIETYYNNQRLHSAIGYQSPRQYEADNELEKEKHFFDRKSGRYPLRRSCQRRSSEQME
jgi:putative transposase